ncbi:protein kinase [Blastocystis sp. subtype 4]|uniref:protein kinase n=1 Tax=Blastocystis sp. subtype 4 TaxID=944170 RepID=UPI0007120FA3|nr:protein kinase [Blastocystis sp. subtype 4]KNB41691.1 protein kinase [Blastocystis sp. subtype 4]|eukprot:XP_014525134.1 protein kinase [Blastocystis sp. subtype 4]
MKPVAKHLRVLIKTNDFMRQEEMASVLIAEIASIIKENHIPSNLHTYNVTPITNNNGILEYLDDFVSLHELRKSIKPRGYDSIGDYFNDVFTNHPKAYKKFRRNFITSLAAYSIVCYVLQVKDRNDGNILIDRHGNLVHIDFGFLLSNIS